MTMNSQNGVPKTLFWQLLNLGSIFLLLVATTVGCSDDDDNKCAGLANACVDPGSLSCSEDNGAVLICEANADGCLVWTDAETCGLHQECSTAGGVAECVCTDGCTNEGETRCNADAVETCIN